MRWSWRLPLLAALGLTLALASCATEPSATGGAGASPPPAAAPAPPAAPANRAAAPPPAAPPTAPGPGPAPHLALLLPLTGRQAGAAAAIRDGFLTAYYVSPSADRPRVRLYDTGATSVADVVDGAVRAGAQFIVGPLTKEEVTAAAQLPAPRPAILALNFLPAGAEPPPRFYQFALSPEAEARDVARRILAEGHHRGVALAPDNEWGARVLAAFQEELSAGGGTLLASSRFDPLATSYAPAIGDVLRVDESTARYRRIESIVGGKLRFQPRRRGDIEFIFAPSSAPVARLLTPQLRYFFAGNVPTYATSEAFEPNPTADEDLEGLEFPDMPWLLGSGLADSVRLAASSAWPVGGPSRNRLFAFGFDAYRLMMALRRATSATVPASGAQPASGGLPMAVSSLSVEGLTGQLTLDPSGHVHRELEWAQMHDGQPRVLAPPRAPSEPAPPAQAPPTQPPPTQAPPAQSPPAQAPPAQAPPAQ